MGRFAHLYNTRRWRRKRASQLRRSPLCEMCRSQGHVTAAHVADHIEPHKGDAALFWGGELQSLCGECHDRHKKMHEQGVAMGCDEDGQPLDNKHWWNR